MENAMQTNAISQVDAFHHYYSRVDHVIMTCVLQPLFN